MFRTKDGRGWGVRSWDTIPQGQFVCEFVGEVRPDEEFEQGRPDEYAFNMRVRGTRGRGRFEAVGSPGCGGGGRGGGGE